MARNRIAAVAVALVLGWAVVFPAGGAETLAQIKTAVDDLKLTGDAKAKSEGILAKAKADIDKAAKGSDRQAAVTQAAREEIAGLLDDDQRLLFETKLKALAQAGVGVDRPPAAPGARRPGVAGPIVRPLQIGPRIKQAVAGLDLSEEQSKKVDGVIANVQQKADGLRGQRPGPEMRQKVMELRDSAIGQMKAILTPDQFEKFQLAMRQSGPAGAGVAAGRPGAAIERFRDAVNDLKLTEDQKGKVDSVFADARKKFADLAPQLQKGQPTAETREKVRSVMQDLRAALTDVLTPEQMEKLRATMRQGDK